MKRRTDLLQALFEPVQTNDDHSNVDKAKIGDDRKEVDDQLLPDMKNFNINTLNLVISKISRAGIDIYPRVETALRIAADTKEEGIDSFQVTSCRKDAKSEQRAGKDVKVCRTALAVSYKWARLWCQLNNGVR